MRIHTLYSILRMKRGLGFSLLAAVAMLLCAPAESQASSTSWVEGVSVAGGWSDFDKDTLPNDGDNNLCWAASASCIIDYWQSLYITTSSIPTGDAIWTRFKEACTRDLTGNQLFGIQWWLAGDYSGSTLRDSDKSNDRAAFNSGTTNNPIPEYSGSFTGYYWDVIPDNYANASTLGPVASHIRNFLWYENGPNVDFPAMLIEKLASAPLDWAYLQREQQHSGMLSPSGGWSTKETPSAASGLQIQMTTPQVSGKFTLTLLRLAIRHTCALLTTSTTSHMAMHT